MRRQRRHNYLLSALPGLEELGSPAPLSKADLLEQVYETHGPFKSVEILCLADDLMQREALLAGELSADEVEMAVLQTSQAEEGGDLPEFLLPEGGQENEDNARKAVDALWERYFHQAAQVARQTGSAFLKAWIGFEVGLRNALVTMRAQRLDLDPTGYLVAPDLADRDLDCSALLTSWSSAPDPLAALQILDKARWEWLTEHGRWFSFRSDEIEAYAAKLILLLRWRRLTVET